MFKRSKRIHKTVLLLFLAAVFIALLIMPVKSQVYHLPGVYGSGPNGLPTCYCPAFFWVTCGCTIKK